MKKFQYSALLFILVAAFAVVFTGCQGGGNDKPLIISNGAEPQSLDPSLIQGVPETNIYIALFEGLMRYDPKTGDGIPGLAESFTVSDDKLTYTFKLRDTVWSDGTKITAQTVVDSWLRTLDPVTASQYAYMVTMVIKGADAYNTTKETDAAKLQALRDAVAIKAIDDKTFEITLTGPAPYVVGMLTHQAFAVMPMHVIAKVGADWIKAENIVSNGPYTLKEWKPQQQITVVKNEKYWDKANVHIASLQFLPIEDLSTSYQKYKNGEIDWVNNQAFPAAAIDEAKLRPEYQVSPQLSTYYYIFNVTKKPVSDAKVRKALAMSLDTAELVSKITKGGEQVANSITPKMAGYIPAVGNAFNVAEAKKLLAEAGFADGKGFPKLTVIYNTSERHKMIAEWVQQQWKTNLGIDIDLQNIEWKTFLDVRSKQHDFVITRAGWVGDYQDPNTFLDMFLTGSGNNDGLYSNAEYDALVKKAATQSGEERMKTLQAAEEILITKDQAVAPFFFYVNQDLIDLNKYEGWYPTANGFHAYVGLKRK
jgi:oligopeptide transport system substrate-binding protein